MQDRQHAACLGWISLYVWMPYTVKMSFGLCNATSLARPWFVWYELIPHYVERSKHNEIWNNSSHLCYVPWKTYTYAMYHGRWSATLPNCLLSGSRCGFVGWGPPDEYPTKRGCQRHWMRLLLKALRLCCGRLSTKWHCSPVVCAQKTADWCSIVTGSVQCRLTCVYSCNILSWTSMTWDAMIWCYQTSWLVMYAKM